VCETINKYNTHIICFSFGQGRGKYVANGSHNHDLEERCKGFEAFYRSVMYNVVQQADPEQDLKQLLQAKDPLLG
jgi:hypothetical protein